MQKRSQSVVDRHRLVLRIYLLSITVVIVIGVTMSAVVHLWVEPAAHQRISSTARYFADNLLNAADDPATFDKELTRLRRIGMTVSVYDAMGIAIMSTRHDREPPLTAEFLARLRAERIWVYDQPGSIALTLSGRDLPWRYAVVDFPGDHPESWAVGAVIAVVLALLAITAHIFSRGIAKPLLQLADAARAFGGGALQTRLAWKRRDEFGELARAFDDMAERVNTLVRSQQELLANVSHELRTPLARIGVALDIAADAGMSNNDGLQQSVGAITEDLHELESLINDLLTATRLDLGNSSANNPELSLNMEEVAVRELVDQAVSRCREIHPDYRVDGELHPHAPATIRVDRTLICRALDNLLSNAAKYSDAGDIVTLRVMTDNHGLCFEVVDHGIGIDDCDRERLFTPFFRSDRSRSRATGGVGLGLALTKKIVVAHGGTIAVDSTPTRGTTVRFTLPIL